ncbi:acyl-CoA dehydrogenase family protein [Arthrobacter oryzae]|uniref:acyl-CoA dehydrogenase family protein n=1 Tax=Arthrobacter oryzae TaxID=409290 RepID=UPI002866847C|nr:acyl-CoA dehydrogenase family protein [Arthrobacter oryzae]MDR6507637.1 alkylation response protein AidB-like acyl-CoA dehydrogenase [Arthrobacter oryzae]
MSIDSPPAAPAGYSWLANEYRPMFESIAAGAAERETDRVLLHRQIRELAAAGFGALRVPRRYGGGGVTATEFVRLLTDLAAAESNLAQSLRAHICFVEDRLFADDAAWLRRIAEGQIVGNAIAEHVSPVPVPGAGATTLTPDGENFRLNGTKSYTTGSLYADWILTGARTSRGRKITVLVRSDAPGLSIQDDWDGFGQRLTASGTAVFDNVLIPAADLLKESQLPYATGIHQLVHVVTLAGITRRVNSDVALYLRSRTRGLSHGNAGLPGDDIQIHQIVGEISAQAFAAEAIVLRVAGLLDEIWALPSTVDPDVFGEAIRAMGIASYQAQIVVTELAQRAASAMFNAMGASATRAGLQLDRHWRNARVVSSHNPVVYKSRIVGDWEINRALPDILGQLG